LAIYNFIVDDEEKEVSILIMPIIHFNITDPIFVGDLWGFILALPTILFLSFWIGSDNIRHPAMSVLGAFVGAVFGFLLLLIGVGTLISATPLPGASGGSTFFSSFLLCSILGVLGGIFTDGFIMHKHTSN
jgi:hypothetical protein